MRKHVRFLVDNGIEILVTNGNTGEFYSLTQGECRRAVEWVVDEIGDAALVVAGIGYGPKTAVDMARHAQDVGAHAVMVHNPVHPYQSAEGLKAYYDAIAGAVDIGVIPYVRNPLIDLDVLTHVTAHNNVVGCKYAVNDLQAFSEVTRALPGEEVGVAWLCGTAEAWAPFFFAGGAKGFTSGLANIVPSMALDMLAALKEGDSERSMRLWGQIKPFEALRARRQSGLNVPVVKEGMELAGMPVGGVRPPIAPLSAPERKELEEILSGWGALGATPRAV